MASRHDTPNGDTPNGNSRRMSPFEPRHGGGYNPYDPQNYEAGGFGFGGTNGSAGGFGAGGMGPQTGSYGSQANYGQGYGGADFDPGATDSRFPGPSAPPRRTWTDAFPHEWKGWGPQTPDDTPEQLRRQRRHVFDDQYLSWREEQLRKLDDDYHAYRQEHQGKFNDDFNAWRNKRVGQVTGSANDVARPASAAKPEPKAS